MHISSPGSQTGTEYSAAGASTWMVEPIAFTKRCCHADGEVGVESNSIFAAGVLVGRWKVSARLGAARWFAYNFCLFAGIVWKQFIGFATGVACACEVADIYLFVSLTPFFERHVPTNTKHFRYIDDGCLPNWMGSRDAAIACFDDINADPVPVQLPNR